MGIDSLIATASFLIGLITALIGILVWYGNIQKKSLAAERDAQHLRRNQEALAQAVGLLTDEVENLRERILQELIEIKALTYGGIVDRHKE